MIQEDERILFVSQAKTAVLGNPSLYLSRREVICEDQHGREEDSGYNQKMSIFLVLVQCSG